MAVLALERPVARTRSGFLEDVRGDDEELAEALRLEPVDLPG